MAEGGGKLVIRTASDEDGRIVVPCRVGPRAELPMLLSTNRPLSYISVDTYRTLDADGYCDFIGRGVYRLRQVQLDDQPVTDLFVRVTGALGILGYEAALGLHFLKQFNEVCFTRATGLLTLTY